MEKTKLTGYPSIDKPWLKYYSEELINTSLPECTMYEAAFAGNEAYMDKVIFEFYGRKITAKRFFEKVNDVAAALTAMSIKRGDTVTICMLNTPETVYLMYAINKIGAIANRLCPVSPEEELLHDINLCNSELLFTLDIFQDRLFHLIDETKIKRVIVANLKQSMAITFQVAATIFKKQKTVPLVKDDRFVSWNQFMQKRDYTFTVNHNPQDVAAIVYTGGTTGGSKGVALTNFNIVATAWQYIHGGADIERNDTWAVVLPMFIAYGVSCALQIPLMVGIKIHLRLPMTDTIYQLAKFKPNHIMSGPDSWNQLAESRKDVDMSFLKEPISGGDTLPAPVERKVNEYLQKQGSKYPLMNGYGMSEVCAAVSCNNVRIHKEGTVGIPFVKNIVSAFDIDTQEEKKIGEEGELCICTPSMMWGYVNNEAETKHIARIHADGKTWIHTGDLGFIDEDGFIHIEGRLKRYLMRYWNDGVKKIFCPDIERHLVKCPMIESCVVVPVTAKLGQAPHAYVVLKDKSLSSEKAIESIKNYCESKMGEVYRPDSFTVIQNYPHTKVGKVDYRALEERAAKEG
ncbi:MAG: acyl--CoA ligase [Oscillospiraceae bacterium]|nr:acyl--CoA ligase [Oscillospiraceae bacterium]